MKPYYQDRLITLYHGDAREVLPGIISADSIITDPVWPNALSGLPGSEDPFSLFKDVAKLFPSKCKRCVIQLGCNSDPRFLAAMPSALPFFRVCTLEYIRPYYLGRLMYTGDIAYVFGEPIPSAPGQRVIPGRFCESKIEPKFRGHPCPRTPGHIRWLVRWFAGTSVIDPFSGGGTTAFVCREAGIPCTAIEINEEFCEAAAERLSHAQMGIMERE